MRGTSLIVPSARARETALSTAHVHHFVGKQSQGDRGRMVSQEVGDKNLQVGALSPRTCSLRKQNSFWDGVQWFQLAFWAAQWAHIHPLPTSTHTHSLSFTAQPGPRKGQRNSSREPRAGFGRSSFLGTTGSLSPWPLAAGLFYYWLCLCFQGYVVM